jgi:hypothetical protein
MASTEPFLLHPENAPFVRGLETQPASVVRDCKEGWFVVVAWVVPCVLSVLVIPFRVLPFLIGPTDTVTATVLKKHS